MAILGIDEVGRGPLAGPLVVGAVILPDDKPEWVTKLKDSKKLSAKKREALNELILKEAVTGLGWVLAGELDEIGISAALSLATRKAVQVVQAKRAAFSQIVIDGKVNFLAGTKLEQYVSTMPKADNLVKEVSAASIIAKVARDNYMVKLAGVYPEYGFDAHVGYGTARHLAAIREYGICDEHRKSFEPIKTMVGFARSTSVVNQRAYASQEAAKNTTIIGGKGENAAAEYLVRAGHTIVERNFKTKFMEIDIVSVCDGKIYFTEVKYRKSDVCGGGLAAINRDKQAKMKFAAESYLKLKRQFADFDPLLAVADVAGDDFHVNTWFSLDS